MTGEQLGIFDQAVRFEQHARDMALDALANTRARLVAAARRVAVEMARDLGRVSSPEVLAELRDRGYGPELDRVDARFMGVVFRPAKGWPVRWRRMGWEPGGSHCRPVAVWQLV